MESIIQRIYNKELGRREEEFDDEEYVLRQKEYHVSYATLEEALNEEQRKLLGKLFLCSGSVQNISEYLYFKDGFKAGFLLGAEIYGKKEKN